MIKDENAKVYNSHVNDFISQLESKNIKLWLDGGALRCKASKGAVTNEILQDIEERKEEVIRFLKVEKDKTIFFEPIQRLKEQEHYPLSATQKRMFILNKMDRESTAYNLTQVLKINDSFDKNRILDVFRQLADRQESLRTSFEIIEGNPVQKVHDHVSLDAAYMEIEGPENQIDGTIKEFIRPYDLSVLPLFRIMIVKLIRPYNTPLFFLIFDMHHIISDGISIAILVKEINELYAYKKLAEPKINYKDYVAWHEKLMAGEIIHNQRDYWMKQLQGEIPVLNLSTDYQRPSKFSFIGNSIRFLIDKELSDKLYNLARKNKVTLFSVLFTAYYVLLFKYTGQNDIIIGTSTAGRRHNDLSEIIGVFINTITLRNFPEPGKAFDEFLKEVGKNALTAFDNQDLPFEQAVEELKIQRDLSRNPIFDAMFILQNMNIGEIKAEGVEISFYDYKREIAQFDITITATENYKGIDVEINYCTSLFNRATVERLGNHFIRILECAVKNPQAKLGEIDILTLKEKNQILYKFNETYAEYSRDKSIHKLFEEQVEKNPESIAVVFKNEQITYRDLNLKANRLAWTLMDKGVKTDKIIALMVDRSFNMIIGILAVLKAGGAYLPIDPEYPPERVKYMLEDSGTKILLSQSGHYERLAESKRFEGDNILTSFEFLDMECDGEYSSKCENPDVIFNPNNLAYVIYTSGSTGKPKGTMLEHKSVINFIKGITDRIDFSAGKTILALTTMSFDIFVLETLLPLSKGVKIAIADENQQKDSRLLNDVIDINNVNMLQITPSRLQLLLKGKSSLSGLKKLKEIMVGGEAFPQNLLAELRNLTKAKIYNMYGPTETTVWSTLGELTGSDAIDIGMPIANTRVYILDKENHLLPPGIAGELCIAGDGLARGYLNMPEFTAEKFLADPFFSGERMYRTGDLARWLANGKLECLGRIDQQVKIRGYRIELGEIEKHLCNFGSIKECAVIAKADELGNKYLTGYYASEHEFPISDLREHLIKSLPDYMIPEIFIHMNKLPATPNGKIDRKVLPEPDYSRPKLLTEYKCAVSDTEKILAGIWQELLRREIVGVEDNFFELGGNSLSLVKMHAELDNHFPGMLNVTDIFAHPTISKLARMIEGGHENKVRNIKTEQLKIPEEYFSHGDLNNESAQIHFKLDSEIFKALISISNKGDRLEDVLLGAFVYLLSEISASQDVPVHAVNETGRILPMKFELENIKDIAELILLAEQKQETRSEKNTFSIQNLRNIKLKKEVQSVLVLFSYDFKEFHSDYAGCYDISLLVDVEKNRANCTIEYNAGRISGEKIEETIYYYVKTIEAIIERLA